MTLYIAYCINIIILLPVCIAMFFGDAANSVFEGKVAPSEGLNLLVGSLWSAILLASIAGLIWPRVLAPILLVQIAYKSIWLCVFVWPLYRAEGSVAVPWGITYVFIAIVLSYPLLWWFGTK